VATGDRKMGVICANLRAIGGFGFVRFFSEYFKGFLSLQITFYGYDPFRKSVATPRNPFIASM